MAAGGVPELRDVSAVQDDLLSALTRGERTQLNALLRRVCATAGPPDAG